MLALFGILTLAAGAMQLTGAPDISGAWKGDPWSTVSLSSVEEAPDLYAGRFSVADGSTGKFEIKWSRLQQRYNGEWRLNANEFGSLTVRRKSHQELRGAISVSPDAKVTADKPRLREFTWRFSSPVVTPNSETVGDNTDKKTRGPFKLVDFTRSADTDFSLTARGILSPFSETDGFAHRLREKRESFEKVQRRLIFEQAALAALQRKGTNDLSEEALRDTERNLQASKSTTRRLAEELKNLRFQLDGLEQERATTVELLKARIAAATRKLQSERNRRTKQQIAKDLSELELLKDQYVLLSRAEPRAVDSPNENLDSDTDATGIRTPKSETERQAIVELLNVRLEAAKAKMQRVRSQYARQREAHESGVLTQSELEKSEAAVTNVEMELKELDVKLRFYLHNDTVNTSR